MTVTPNLQKKKLRPRHYKVDWLNCMMIEVEQLGFEEGEWRKKV